MVQDEQTARAMLVQARYSEMLLDKRNVVGVAVGLRMTGGQYTGEVCLVVMVSHKTPPAELTAEDIIPSELDGVPVDVQEIGTPRAY